MLDHPGASRRGDDRAHGGDVHRVRAVPAGADQVDEGAGHADRGGLRSITSASPASSAGVSPFIRRATREPGDLDRRRGALHDLVHRPGGLVRAEGLAPDQRADQGPPGQPHGCRMRHGGMHGPPPACSAAGLGGQVLGALAHQAGQGGGERHAGRSGGWSRRPRRTRWRASRRPARPTTSSTGGQSWISSLA